jgi:hypothetical protein
MGVVRTLFLSIITIVNLTKEHTKFVASSQQIIVVLCLLLDVTKTRKNNSLRPLSNIAYSVFKKRDCMQSAFSNAACNFCDSCILLEISLNVAIYNKIRRPSVHHARSDRSYYLRAMNSSAYPIHLSVLSFSLSLTLPYRTSVLVVQ